MIKIKKTGNNVLNKDHLLDYINNLEDGSYNIYFEKAEVGQAKYFFYRDVIARELGYGTRKEKEELHQMMKKELLLKVFEDPLNLNTEDYDNLSFSTKHLSERGWWKLNQSVEIWANTKFDIILK